jgi:O-antigen/teichoic acid export membrane protein
MMDDEVEPIISRDSLSLNVLSESVSRGLSYVAGIISAALLVRSIDDVVGSIWTTTDYANLKVLMSWNQIILALLLVGLGTPIVKTISEHANKRESIGTVLTASLMTVTFVYIVIIITTTLFAEPIGFLNDPDPILALSRRMLWPLVLFSLYPTAIIQITRSAFVGIQRVKKILIADISYNLSRILFLTYLFFTMTVTTFNVLLMFLITTLIATTISIILLLREMRAANITITLVGWSEIAKPLFSLASVFLVLGFVSAFFNYATTLFVDTFGNNLDVTRFSISQSLIQTIKAFLYTPFAVLLPNLSNLASRGGFENLKGRFDETNRIIIPTLLFTFLVVIVFGNNMLGAVFGTEGTDSSGGLSANEFLFALSFGLFLLPLTGIYSNLLSALGRVKPLLITGVFSIVLQTAWIIFLQPLYGVIVIAYSWVVYIPVYIIYHIYCKRTFSLYVPAKYLGRILLLAILFLPLVMLTLLLSENVLLLFVFIPFLTITTFSSLFRLLFVLPLWYIFIGISLAIGATSVRDLDNMKRMLKRIPPAWWVSRPLLNRIEKLTTRGKANDIHS